MQSPKCQLNRANEPFWEGNRLQIRPQQDVTEGPREHKGLRNSKGNALSIHVRSGVFIPDEVWIAVESDKTEVWAQKSLCLAN
jgi:hypothetical protein